MRPLRAVYRAFDATALPLAWAELVVGLVCALLTLVDVLPPGWGNPYGVMIGTVAWLLFAQEARNELRDRLQDVTQ